MDIKEASPWFYLAQMILDKDFLISAAVFIFVVCFSIGIGFVLFRWGLWIGCPI